MISGISLYNASVKLVLLQCMPLSPVDFLCPPRPPLVILPCIVLKMDTRQACLVSYPDQSLQFGALVVRPALRERISVLKSKDCNAEHCLFRIRNNDINLGRVLAYLTSLVSPRLIAFCVSMTLKIAVCSRNRKVSPSDLYLPVSAGTVSSNC